MIGTKKPPCRKGHDTVTGETIVGLAAQVGTEQVAQRTQDEDQADLVERAGGVLRQAGQCRPSNSGEQAQDENGQIISCGECQLVDGNGGCGCVHLFVGCVKKM